MDRDALSAPAELSNSELLARVEGLAQNEREATASLIVHLAELDARRLYLGEGCSSLFTYCTHVLHFSEHAAYGRIEAARTGRRFPAVLEMLEDASINLTTVCMLTAHLTHDNHRDLLAAATHKSKRQVEELVARLRPKPVVLATVRKLPAPSPAVEGAVAGAHPSAYAPPLVPLAASASPRAAVVAALAPERYRVQFTVSAETCDKLRLVQDLLRHQIPDGDPAQVFDRALTVLLDHLTRQKLAATDRPRGSRGTAPGSRHIPADVKRAVWIRDGGRCAFIANNGRRCAARGLLEFHHVTPHAAGGEPATANIQLRCRAHNGYEAELFFGPRPTAVGEGRASYAATRSGPSTGVCGGRPRAPG